MEWSQATIGCYWTSDDGYWHIATFHEVCGGEITKSGYRLFAERQPVHDLPSLEAAKKYAELQERKVAWQIEYEAQRRGVRS